ncbi:MAG: hypothetical protein HY608_09885, partial [Planctomycetes bacterium]|nr:hypothetical protein [Planctomycetota bacterium]
MSNREEHKMRRDAGGTPPLNRLATWCALFLILVLLRAADASPLDEARALHEEAQRILTGDRPSQERHALAIRLLSAARTLLGDTGTPEARGLLREVSAALYWARKFQRTSQDPSQPSADETSAQCAFQKADDLEHSRTASVETIRRAYEEVRDRYPGTSWAIRAGMRVHSVAEPTPAPQRDPSPAQPRDQGPPLLDEFTLAVRERRLDDAWGWLDRARKQPPSEPVDLAAVEADLATLDWVAIRALGAMLGKVGG